MLKKILCMACFMCLVTASELFEFIDQADNKVSINIPVKKMIVMQHHSIDILTMLGATDKIIGVEKDYLEDLGEYIHKVFPSIQTLPKPGDLKSWNIEEIAKLKPDVVIAASQANKNMIEQVKKLGIKVVVVSLRGEGVQKEAQNPRLSNADKAYTDGLKWSLFTLAKLTGTSKKADEIWDFVLSSRKIVTDKLDHIDDEKRVKVFVANPADHTYGNDKYVGTMLLRAGAINVASKEIQGYKPYTFEALLKWNPDVIIIQDRYQNVYDQFISHAKYKTLKAVKNNNVLLAPFWTKPWGNPGVDSMALGELYLAYKFYPSIISKQIVEDRAKEFYERFYGVKFFGKVE